MTDPMAEVNRQNWQAALRRAWRELKHTEKRIEKAQRRADREDAYATVIRRDIARLEDLLGEAAE